MSMQYLMDYLRSGSLRTCVNRELLNFSGVDHAIAEGDAFLRVSFFEHKPVTTDKMRKAPPLDAYLKDIQKMAAANFPSTYLDSDEIAKSAGDHVLERVRKEALVWVASVALLFTVLQIGTPIVVRWLDRATNDVTRRDIDELRLKFNELQVKALQSQASAATSRPPATTKLPSQPSTPSQAP
jgi:hypothetical protein